MTNNIRKSHRRYRLVPKSMTFDDLERSLHTLLENTCIFGARREDYNEDRPVLSAK